MKKDMLVVDISILVIFLIFLMLLVKSKEKATTKIRVTISTKSATHYFKDQGIKKWN